MNTKTRAVRRVLARGAHIGGSVRGASRKTGQPEWFQAMKWEGAKKKHLQKLPVSELAKYGACTEKQANILGTNGIKTVWDLVDASYESLLKVPSFGPKTLAKLKQDMMIKVQVKANWSVPSNG